MGFKANSCMSFLEPRDGYSVRTRMYVGNDYHLEPQWVKNTMTNESRQAAQEAVLELSKQIKGALGKAGLDPVEHMDDIATLMHALAVDATHILWLDSDMRFPADTLGRLLARNRDIVGANYCARRFP